MDIPITFNLILEVLGILVALVGGYAAGKAIIKAINDKHDKEVKYENYGKEIKEIKTEQYVLVNSMYAVLDGLHQLKCNGEVTKARNELGQYLNKTSHDIEA